MNLFDLGRGGRPLRIAYGRIFHEANAYTPLTTERRAFTDFHHLEGAELAAASSLGKFELAGFLPAAEMTGFVTAARAAGGVETVPLASSLAVPSGPLTADCFEWLVDNLIARLRSAGAVDGVYLALHGAMQVVGLKAAPESVILKRVREVLGPDAKVAVSYDLHGNLSPGLVEPVDVLVAYQTNPHYDLAQTGFRAGNRLIRTLRGQVTPVHAWRKLPIVLGGGTTISFLKPMNQVFRLMKRLERDPNVLTTSLFMVHPFTAASDLGWAVHVSTDGDQDLADRIADQLADEAWSRRKVPLPPMRSPRQAIDDVLQSPWRRLGPVTLVDVADIVGAGAPGGNTQILEALVDRPDATRAFLPIHDPRLVEELWEVSVGDRVDVTVRGTEGYDQPAVPVRATVAAKAETEFGRTIRLDIGRISAAITANAPLPIHPRFWRAIGLKARDADLIVQKNFFHYRIFYAVTSFDHIPVVSEGASSLDHVKRRVYSVPTFPVDDPPDWRAADPKLRSTTEWSAELSPVAPT